MSELIVAPADPRDLVEEPEHVLEGVRQPPVVITEQLLIWARRADADIAAIQ